MILNFCSLNHVNDLIKTDNINTINRYLLLHMCLFMDINLTALFVSSFHIEGKIKKNHKKK